MAFDPADDVDASAPESAKAEMTHPNGNWQLPARPGVDGTDVEVNRGPVVILQFI